MAANTTPIFTLSPLVNGGQVSTANTNRDGTGTLATLYTVGADGGRIDYVRAKATVTTTAGMVRIFVSTDGGTTKRLWAEMIVTAITVGASTAAWEGEFVPTRPLLLPASAVVYASTHNAEAINVFAHGGNY